MMMKSRRLLLCTCRTWARIRPYGACIARSWSSATKTVPKYMPIEIIQDDPNIFREDYASGKRRYVAAYNTVERYNLEQLKELFSSQARVNRILNDVGHLEMYDYGAAQMLHVVARDREQSLKDRHIVFFRSGGSVYWGYTLPDRQRIISLLDTEPYAVRMTRDIGEFDHEFEYKYMERGRPSVLTRDVFYVRNDSGVRRRIDMAVFSILLSQSVKLRVWESTAEAFSVILRQLTQTVSQQGKRPVTRGGEFTRLWAQLTICRYDIVAEINDRPRHFFWKRPHLEDLYDSASTELEIQRRRDVLDRRISVLGDTIRNFSDLNSENRSTRIEVLIAFLIAVEIAISLLTLSWDDINLFQDHSHRNHMKSNDAVVSDGTAGGDDDGGEVTAVASLNDR